MIKVCRVCQKSKPTTEFHKHKPGKYGVRGTCKDCISLYRNTTGKEKQLKKRYNITIEKYNELYNNQKGCCAICGIHQDNLKSSLAVDHNHESLEIRGLLCYNCNMGLGRFQDSVGLLEKAIVYIMSRNDGNILSLSVPDSNEKITDINI